MLKKPNLDAFTPDARLVLMIWGYDPQTLNKCLKWGLCQHTVTRLFDGKRIKEATVLRVRESLTKFLLESGRTQEYIDHIVKPVWTGIYTGPRPKYVKIKRDQLPPDSGEKLRASCYDVDNFQKTFHWPMTKSTAVDMFMGKPLRASVIEQVRKDLRSFLERCYTEEQIIQIIGAPQSDATS